MTQSPALLRPSRFALTGEALSCLELVRRGVAGGDIPPSTRSFLLARGYVEAIKDGVAVTPRGRTALLCARP